MNGIAIFIIWNSFGNMNFPDVAKKKAITKIIKAKIKYLYNLACLGLFFLILRLEK
ncbi:MAG: hypothetical protein CFH20_00803 [Alphaproteobacteria bacterium MarineAlpha5_Bin10]|nr:MAG: hypothetical protein CFH20_00803 [Alphaproteobacteria bacterium MarineAlpha5_Bin10]